MSKLLALSTPWNKGNVFDFVCWSIDFKSLLICFVNVLKHLYRWFALISITMNKDSEKRNSCSHFTMLRQIEKGWRHTTFTNGDCDKLMWEILANLKTYYWYFLYISYSRAWHHRNPWSAPELLIFFTLLSKPKNRAVCISIFTFN